MRAVGRVLAERLPGRACPCRYGGDEFVIALPGFSARDAGVVADDIRRAVNALAPVLAGVTFPVGALAVSVGIAGLDDGHPGWDPAVDAAAVGEALFQAADAALYAAKRGGRNRVATGGVFSAA